MESNWIRRFAWVIFGIGTIVAFIIGISRWSIALYAEIGNILLTAFFLALASIFEQVRNTARYLRVSLTEEQNDKVAQEIRDEKDRKRAASIFRM